MESGYEYGVICFSNRAIIKMHVQEFCSCKIEGCLESLFETWNQANQAIRIERLTEVERLQDYVVTPVPDEKPWFPTEDKKSSSIRMLCLWINLNFIHRILLRINGLFKDVLRRIDRARQIQPSSDTISQSVPENETSPLEETSE
ncbi:hypothetical protein NPIL_343791 [Nephila pilipes]|uniref:Uncharacterized protein n=1 Tax=Nephila pilipes TaxID=299642 RepID=A0A8X6UF87_NEPPI|nr:hypothetical protein NPIL_343791 [Nephila pilipes]